MPVVATGELPAPLPGVWHRLSLLSSDGTITGLAEERLIGQLEEVGIPRHQGGLVRLLRSWQRARVPPDVALALWLLREQEARHGLIYRHASVPVEDVGPAIRYIQLAAAVGEDRSSDPTLDRLVSWLLDRQLPDGSIPITIPSAHGETGQTARALRALWTVQDEAIADRLNAIGTYLRGTARPQPTGSAWASSRLDETVVTGSTSLAVTALIEFGMVDEVVLDGLAYLLSAQELAGGWAEVPGYRQTIQNTFQVVRAIRVAQQAGVLDSPEAATAVNQARRWFGRAARRTPRSVLEHAFALRTAAQLDLLDQPNIEQLACRLSQRRRQFLESTADMYADTEIAALALLEASRSVDRSPDGSASWKWRWRLPSPTPPFLARGAYFYELLYGLVRSRWWIRGVDVLVHRRVVDRAAGLLLGAMTSIGLVDNYVASAVVANDASNAAYTVVIVGLLLVVWFGIKAASRSSVWKALTTSGSSLAAAGVVGLMLDSHGPVFPAMVSLIGLRWLVIDVIAYTADSTGLLDQLLPKS